MSINTDLADRMAEAANEFIASLDDAQRSSATWPSAITDERERWFYTPTDHGGLSLASMTPRQQRLTHRLLSTGLSEAGYVTAAAIMGMENILDRLEGWQLDWGRERGRDPQLYWMAVFGSPGPEGLWGWRFGGHHVSVNVAVLDGRIVGTTPLFFGADPASAPLLGPHLHRPLGGAEDLGRELVRSLSDEHSVVAVASPVPPADLVTANRRDPADGDRPLSLAELWRGRFGADLDASLAGMDAALATSLGVDEASLSAVEFTKRPKGLLLEQLTADQREIALALLDVYLGRLPDGLADEQLNLAVASWDQLRFLWAGSTEPAEPHYYRIQGPELLIEYDNVARGANHVHTVWRDLRFDFGRDALAEHYAVGHEHDIGP